MQSKESKKSKESKNFIKRILPAILTENSFDNTKIPFLSDAELAKKKHDIIYEMRHGYHDEYYDKFVKPYPTSGPSDLIRFDDRTYFGENDALVKNQMKDMISAAVKVGIDPYDMLITAAMENRFSNEGEVQDMRLTDGSWRHVIPSFADFVIKKGLHKNEKYVVKDSGGYQLDADYFYDMSDDELRKTLEIYNKWKEKNPKPEFFPYYVSAKYLKEKGIQGYNPQELKGNIMYKQFGGKNKLRKDRMQRYNEIKNILSKEKDFNENFNKMLKEIKGK